MDALDAEALALRTGRGKDYLRILAFMESGKLGWRRFWPGTVKPSPPAPCGNAWKSLNPMNSTTPKPWPEALLPWAVAESICAEAGVFLGVAVPRRRARWLEAKAQRCFEHSRHFRAKMLARGEAPLHNLRMFMRHWLASLLQLERPDLWYALPPYFAMGVRLPAEKHPRVNRHHSGPLPRARRWNPACVLAHPRWHFLAPTPNPERPVQQIQPPRPTEPPPTHVRPAPTPLMPTPYHALYEYPIC